LQYRTEDEKKVIAPLLGKLYVSPASSEDKIRDLYEEVDAAVDSKLLTDATSRNALYKIHVSLGKIVNALSEQQDAAAAAGRRLSRSTSVATSSAYDATVLSEEKTIVAYEPTIKEEDVSGEGTVLHHPENDSLVEDLLTDEGGA